MVLGSSVDDRGVRTDDAEPTEVGVDVKLLLVPGAGVDVSALADVASSPRVVGVVAPSADAAAGFACAVFTPGDGCVVECVKAP